MAFYKLMKTYRHLKVNFINVYRQYLWEQWWNSLTPDEQSAYRRTKKKKLNDAIMSLTIMGPFVNSLYTK